MLVAGYGRQMLLILQVTIHFSVYLPQVESFGGSTAVWLLGKSFIHVPPLVDSDTLPRSPKSTKRLRKKRSINQIYQEKVSTSEAFVREHLEITNKYRAVHGVPPLQLDYKLCAEAEGWAKELVGRSEKEEAPVIVHSWKFETGENIFAERTTSNHTLRGWRVAAKWYSQCKQHDWVRNFFSPKSARFSQMVWKDTERMGIGMATSHANNLTIVVARYLPCGNWGYYSAFKKNVFPQQGGGERCFRHNSSVNISTLKIENILTSTSPPKAADAFTVRASESPEPSMKTSNESANHSALLEDRLDISGLSMRKEGRSVVGDVHNHSSTHQKHKGNSTRPHSGNGRKGEGQRKAGERKERRDHSWKGVAKGAKGAVGARGKEDTSTIPATATTPKRVKHAKSKHKKKVLNSTKHPLI